MKKLAIVIALAGLAAPAFACPMSDHEEAAAPKTAEKAKDTTKAKDATADKAKDTKPADTAKTAKPADGAKKPDKVSIK